MRVWILENCKEVIHPPSNLTIKFKDFAIARCAEFSGSIGQTSYTEKVKT
jgi:hypothetical protein